LQVFKPQLLLLHKLIFIVVLAHLISNFQLQLLLLRLFIMLLVMQASIILIQLP
jgi:hypothetical protein